MCALGTGVQTCALPISSGSSAIFGQARVDATLLDIECRTLVGLGVEPALADLFAAIAQACADFPLRQGVALVAHPVAATAVAVAMAAVAMPVAGRGPRWRRRGWFDIAKAQRRRPVATARDRKSGG